jgi:hypothetical protein
MAKAMLTVAPALDELLERCFTSQQLEQCAKARRRPTARATADPDDGRRSYGLRAATPWQPVAVIM